MIKIYNTLTRKKEILKPKKRKKINFFACGVTVYNYIHIGHAKNYIQLDVIVKYLRHRGYNVFYLQNVTDIDDKIIQRAKEKKMDPLKLARDFENFYHEDEKKLGIDSVNAYARATDYIEQIVDQVKKLIKKGYVYKLSDGYYFNIKKFKDYGKLAGRTQLSQGDAVSRIDLNLEKINPGDFCVWKFSKKGEPVWQTEIGDGRPGWHIEDTAITEFYFGPQYDIHAGGRDLIFPHHESEIAIMESISGKKPLAKYWLHIGHLTVQGQKMSKSLKNFILVREILKKYDPKVIRFFFLNSHYRSPLDFREESLKNVQSALERLNEFGKYTLAQRLKDNKFIWARKDHLKLLNQLKKKFYQAMDDDFNTVKAIAVIFEFIKKSYQTKTGGKKTYHFLKEINKIFGILDLKDFEIPEKVKKIVKEREGARKIKDFKKADQLRKKIQKMGFEIKDTSEGPEITKK